MLPMEALSTSTDGSAITQSAGSGLILILNLFLWSSSSSDSSEEKKWDLVVVGGSTTSRNRTGLRWCEPTSKLTNAHLSLIKLEEVSQFCEGTPAFHPHQPEMVAPNSNITFMDFFNLVFQLHSCIKNKNPLYVQLT